ncbi:MAG: hypothetical protein Q4G59_04530 [Planctomycetia bacterium]|nr:hypothetical protein [Planctomycetia bacterium]
MIDISLQQANTYFSNRVHAETWSTAQPQTQQKAITWACQLIDGLFEPSPSAFPKDEANNTIVPTSYIAAVCEQALWVLRLDPAIYPEALIQGIASAAAAGASVTFSRQFITPLLCPAAQCLLSKIGTCHTDAIGSIDSTTLDC